MKNILLTGASGNLGINIIKQLLDKPYRIFAQYSSNNYELLEIQKNNSNITLLRANFEDNCKDFLEVISQNNIDIFICNSGIINHPKSFLQVDEDEWYSVMRVNFDFPRIICKHLLPNMLKNNFGKMIFISSIYGKVAASDFSPYVVSKHALIALSKQIAKEYAPNGIRANALCPSTINSNMMRELAKVRSIESNITIEDYISNLKTDIPLGRLAEVEDIAVFVKFLCSDDADFICGTEIVIDGAQLA